MNLKVNEIALDRDKLKEVCFAANDLNGLKKLRKEKEGFVNFSLRTSFSAFSIIK